MRALLHRLHSQRDRAVAWVCAAGLAFVVLILPQLADPQPVHIAVTQATRP